MFDYPDDGYREVFLRPDRALRRAREILIGLEEAERILAPPKQVAETPAPAA
jgi:vanillate O-demethylase monooxygenase subunit